jgi:hypothetical protein
MIISSHALCAKTEMFACQIGRASEGGGDAAAAAWPSPEIRGREHVTCYLAAQP